MKPEPKKHPRNQTLMMKLIISSILMLSSFSMAADPTVAKDIKKHGPFNGEFSSGGHYGFNPPFSDREITKGTSDWSMNFWIKPEGNLPQKMLLAGFGRVDSANGAQRYLAVLNHKIAFWSHTKDILTTGKLEADTWQMLTVVNQNGNLTIYKDAQALKSQPIALADAKTELKLAPSSRWADGSRFSGKIALFTLTNCALSEEGVKALHTKNNDFDSLSFTKGVPSTWPPNAKPNFNPPIQPSETLPKSNSVPQKPGAPKPPTLETLVKNSDRGFTLAGPWKLIEAAKVKADAAQLSLPGVLTNDWMAATVPGTVLTTMVDQGIYPHPYFGLNNLAIPENLSRQDYWYRLEFDAPPESAEGESFILFNGINYQAEVWLNGKLLGAIKGAFIRGDFNTTGILKLGQKNALAVKVSPTPNPGIPHEQSIAGQAGLNGGSMVADGPTFFPTEGWDWIPGIRDRNTGIWQNVELHLTGQVTLGDPHVITRIPEPVGTRADVSIEVELQNKSNADQSGVMSAKFEGVEVEKKVTIPAKGVKSVKFTKAEFSQLSVQNPRLWWPNGYGKPELYHLNLTFTGSNGKLSDTKTLRFGMRETSVVISAMDSKQTVNRYEFHPTEAGAEQVIKNDHASLLESVEGWVPSIADKKPNLPGLKPSDAKETAPYLEIRVNGQRIPLRGGNWGMDDAMKNVSRGRLEPYVRLQRDANFNVLRNWCGQSMEKDLFDLCDEYGILVFNEFWLTTQGYNLDPKDQDLLLANAADTIKRFRNHPSIVIWCGRNEGVPPPGINQGLDELIRTLDGTRYYQANSRSINLSGSGPWKYTSLEHFYHSKGFSTEQGLPSPLTADSIRSMMAPEDLWPPNDVWAYHDWVPSSAMDVTTFMAAIETWHGAPTDFEDFVRKTQMMNYVAHRAMYEGMNASLWTPSTGRFLWMSHPSWSSMVWQIYGWDYQANASYYGVKKACEPVHVQLN